MENSTKSNFSGLMIAIIVVVAVIFFFVGYFSHVSKAIVSVPSTNVSVPTAFSSSSTIGVYGGPAGLNNSEHLIGGDVFAIPKGATNLNAIDTVITFFLSTQAQEELYKLGWPPIDTEAYAAHPVNTTLPTYNGPAVTVTMYDDLGVSASATQIMEDVLIPEFESIYPNIKINWIQLRPDQITSDVEALVESGKVGATVIAQDNLAIGELFYPGYLDNITNASSLLPSDLIPSMAGLVTYERQTYKGVYFLPYRANLALVWYNPESLAKAGFTTPPTNWTELLKLGKALTSLGLGGISMQGHGGASTSTEMFQWMVQAGGNPMVLNDSGDVAAYYYMYNLSAYFSPAYTHDYWASYKGLNNNEYNFFDYQWPGSLDNYESIATSGTVVYNTTNATYTNTSAASQAILAAFNQGAFFRPPVAWITEWDNLADNAFTEIVTNDCGATACTESSIQSILNNENLALYKYLVSNYNTTYAQQYEEGYFAPLKAA
ncbi:MAG: ABC transporter substrate-binding protein [Candidatus Parvarchaeum sp.]